MKEATHKRQQAFLFFIGANTADNSKQKQKYTDCKEEARRNQDVCRRRHFLVMSIGEKYVASDDT